MKIYYVVTYFWTGINMQIIIKIGKVGAGMLYLLG